MMNGVEGKHEWSLLQSKTGKWYSLCSAVQAIYNYTAPWETWVRFPQVQNSGS